jgi:hypothetical protein
MHQCAIAPWNASRYCDIAPVDISLYRYPDKAIVDIFLYRYQDVVPGHICADR